MWRAYGLVGSGPPKPGRAREKQHSPAIYVIDQAGKRRWYLSTNFEGAPPASAPIVQHVKALLAAQESERLSDALENREGLEQPEPEAGKLPRHHGNAHLRMKAEVAHEPRHGASHADHHQPEE